MVLRIAFFVLMAVGLLGFGTVAWIATRTPPKPHIAAQPVTTSILVAARAVRAGSLLQPEDMQGKPQPRDHVDPSATIDTPANRRALIGAMVRHSLSSGDVIHNNDVMRPGDHGFLAAVLKPGMRAVTVGVDAITGSAGLIWPGDRVDLILTQSIAANDVPMGQRVAAETVLSDVRVIAIDQRLVQGAEPGTAVHARTVTLEVTPDQAERISVATRLGMLSLSVRSAEHVAAGHLPAPPPPTTWASDVSPALGMRSTGQETQTMRIYQGTADGKEFRF
ncbi:MAG: Flp pilus assembly protein CpaB [Rhodospirillales bacterium]|nr:Flp pilus assembly protein CpaB [Rhodospirillales bacterium]